MKKRGVFKRLFFALLLFTMLMSIPDAAKAVIADQWVVRYNGTGNSDDRATAVAVDDTGNVYVTGQSTGSGTFYDYYTVKYDTDGTFQWEQRYNGTGNGTDGANAIAVDSAGNVYVTGKSWGLDTGFDYYTVKYDTNGTFQWEQRYNGTGNGPDYAEAIAVDNAGNVYVTGLSVGSGTNGDYYTVKYDTDGTFQWEKRYNGTGTSSDAANAIAVDNTGNVYVTGESDGDYYTVKYDTNGTFQWEQRYNGTGNGTDGANAIAVDSAGNVYVTGKSHGSGTGIDYYTAKYNTNGVFQWEKRYNGTGNGTDYASAITVDDADNVYVTGWSDGTLGVDSLFADYYTVKYDTNGTFQWEQRYNGSANRSDTAQAIAVDNGGNVYVTGGSTALYGADGFYDYYTVKYASADGAKLWEQLINTSPDDSNDTATAIAVDNGGNVYVTGSSWAALSDTREDYATIKYTDANVFLNIDKSGSGTVTSSPPGIDCGADCTGYYLSDDAVVVTLTAVPDSGFSFEGWIGDPDCEDGVVTMDRDVSCTAVFSPTRNELSVNFSGSGSGTVSTLPSGINCRADQACPECTELYAEYTTIYLRHSADSGSIFTGWSGDPDCSDGVVTMDVAKTCTANFELVYAMTVATSGSGTGTVTSSPPGIDCGSDCTEDYVINTSVTLTPVADPGSIFTGWTGDADCSDGMVTMSAAQNCTANFELIYTLTVTPSGSGTVTSSPPGITCGSGGADCTEDYINSTIVTLTPNADSGSTFTGWSGDPDCSDGVVTMDAAKACTANFELIVTLTVTPSGSGTGTVTSNPPGISCGEDCTETYFYGTGVTLTATPDGGSNFGGWINCDLPSGDTCTMTGTADGLVTAIFTPFIINTLDSTGTVGLDTSIATDSFNNAHISYWDAENNDLKYCDVAGLCGDTVDSTGGEYTSIAIDYSSNTMHISYVNTGQLMYATNESGSWVNTVIDGTLASESTSIAVDALGKIHISYYDAYNDQLTYVTNSGVAAGTGSCSNTDWDCTSITSGVGPRHHSIAIDSSDNPHIIFHEQASGYLIYTSTLTSWVNQIIATSGGTLGYNSIAIDYWDYIHVSYYDSSGHDLKYATNIPGGGTCISADWNCETVDSSGDVGQYNSIGFDSSGYVHISYYDFYDGTKGHLKYATNISGSWVAETVDSSGNVGQYSSIAVDFQNGVHISYFDAINADLKYAYMPCPYKPVRIAGAIPDYYSWVQWAYDASVGGTIEIQDNTFAEDLIFDRNVSITIDAGYDCNYSTNTGGVTTINGNMTVSNGSVIIQSGTLQVQ